MARPKLWNFTLADATVTVIYWPTDTWVSTQEYGFNFRVISGSGSFATGCSAASSIDRILQYGAVSAHWTERVAFSTGTAATFTTPASCWRLTVRSSGAATFEIMALQSGPERVS
jgi:hypothetical protein